MTEEPRQWNKYMTEKRCTADRVHKASGICSKYGLNLNAVDCERCERVI